MILYLEGLNCGECAEKIRLASEKIKGVENAEINFAAKKLTLHLTDDSADKKLIFSRIRKIISGLEQGIKVNPAGSDKKELEGIEDGEKTRGYIKAARLAVTIALFIFGILSGGKSYELWVFVSAYFIIGYDVLQRALKNILKGKPFDECFLMALASLGAFLIRGYHEAVAVMFLYQLGEMFQDYAVNRSRKSIAELLDIRPDYAVVKKGVSSERVPPETVSPGDIIIVKAGEKIPLDAVVTTGETLIDTSALTGESIPRKASAGTQILSGCVSLNGYIEAEVTKEYGESTVSKILELVENSSAKKARTENFITRFAKVYTPAVVIMAVLMALIPFVMFIASGADTAGIREWVTDESGWFYRSLQFLVVSCPCALVISVPLSYFGGIGGASKIGVLVKGSNSLETLAECRTVVFDKTGTLTNGSFEVIGIKAHAGSDEEQLLKFAAYAEHNSNHPAAMSIMKKFRESMPDENVPDGIISGEIAGMGVKAVYTSGGEKLEILAGNSALMVNNNIETGDMNGVSGTVVHVAANGSYLGFIRIADDIKPDAQKAVSSLKKEGIRTVMLTGDRTEPASDTAKLLGIDEFRAGLLPQDKVAELERIMSENAGNGGKTIFAGDGINDAPVLMRADAGIAMGALGSDAAVEAADVVLMTDEPSRIAGAIRISRKTRRIVRQNIILSIGIKVIVLVLSMLGITAMWTAVFADVGVCFIAVLNAMRARH